VRHPDVFDPKVRQAFRRELYAASPSPPPGDLEGLMHFYADRDSRSFINDSLARFMRETDKPVLCGEFSFPPFYDGQHGFGRYGPVHAKDDAEAGELYRKWVRDAAANPYCVGLGWFTYRDQPLTGRGPGRGDRLVIGEHFAFGLITETGRPKWDLVRRMREANLAAALRRLEAMTPKPNEPARRRDPIER